MTRLIVIFFFGKKTFFFFFFEVLTSVLQACYPCPSYGNNNHPSLCHRKWRQLCFLPTRLIYGLLATLDHWHPQHWQPNWHHQDHHEHDEHCDRPSVETANCSGRCNCDFTLFSIFKLNLKTGHNCLDTSTRFESASKRVVCVTLLLWSICTRGNIRARYVNANDGLWKMAYHHCFCRRH